MILRFLNIQGIVGIIVSLALLALLLVAKGETRHWRKQSEQFEQLYRGEQAAFARTVANYRAAADAARAADRAADERVRAEQRTINERTAHDYQARMAAVRARAVRLQLDAGAAATHPCGGGGAAMPGLSAAPCRPAQAAGQDRLSDPDRLTATEQAIQLDELIRWVNGQARIDPNAREQKAR
jgi:hypothetical protein